MTLAYVFWHWTAQAAPPYRARLTGTSYDEFFDRLRPLVGRGMALWQRQMTLGPTPEFCLQSAGPITFPGELAGVRVACRSV